MLLVLICYTKQIWTILMQKKKKKQSKNSFAFKDHSKIVYQWAFKCDESISF